jgi:ATP-dependent helicase/nuclease subunit B
VKVKFLLGAAGSGKTYKCLEEIKSELKASPDGLPLIFVAPKQFTFQLERQILADPEIKGYTRLFIFSYERLADFIISHFSSKPTNPILSEEGRVMVLRSILSKIEPSLKAYGRSVKYVGFSLQLSQLLHELKSFGITPNKLKKGGQNPRLPIVLRNKLEDLALILENYQQWLNEHKLFDTSKLLEVAIEVLSINRNIEIGGLWLDGFATLSELQIELLAKLLPKCHRATLAFCVDADSYQTNKWFSKGFTVGTFFSKCKNKIEAEDGCEVEVEILKPLQNRFNKQPELARLEKGWGDFSPVQQQQLVDNFLKNESEWWNNGGVRVVSCSNPLAEIVFAARTIREYARRGGRYREIAVLMRNLDDYNDLIRRIFCNYEIPFFIDRRESVSHHPVAELIRYALRLVAYNWRSEDLFGALKLGFAPASDFEIDWLENEAIANGWSGKFWQLPLQLDSTQSDEEIRRLDELLNRVVEPLVKFEKILIGNADGEKPKPAAKHIVNAIKTLFVDWNVEKRLDEWRDELIESKFRSYLPPAMHQTVIEELDNLLSNFELAFGDENRELAEWIQIIESGLSGLTVGVIPPSLDQVLIGAIDRSRNPELKLVIVIGLNEGVFPKTPSFSPILNETERAILADENIYNGLSPQMLLALEWYYGYIACTRPSKYLILTYPTSDWYGNCLNPSPFITHIQRLFPGLQTEYFFGVPNWIYAEHPYELSGVIASGRLSALAKYLPSIEPLITQYSQRWNKEDSQVVPVYIVELLFGDSIKTSVSALEDYANCPFKFFVRYVLRAEERIVYEVDPRHIGTFQHLVLERFHKSVIEEKRQWRDLSPEEAAERIGDIAEKTIQEYNNKLFLANPSNLFQARVLAQRLKDFIKVNVEWLNRSYKFDPTLVEVGFGYEDSNLPPITIKIDDRRQILICGRIDRIDVYSGAADVLPCVVVDYKSGAKNIDPLLLASGVQLQLPLYLILLRQIDSFGNIFGNKKIVPVGVFYANLRGDFRSVKSRDELYKEPEKARRLAYQYHGRFNADYLDLLDSRPDGENSGQFNYNITKNGKMNPNCVEPTNSIYFNALEREITEYVSTYGRKIFSGIFSIDPWKKKNGDSACDNCSYSGICRIDFLNHKWRIVRCWTGEQKST